MAVAGGTVAIPFQAFSVEQRALLAAVCEQMLPSDDLPGAKEAGVVQYVEQQQLAGPCCSTRQRIEARSQNCAKLAS
jgi:hypothetical protein